MRWEKLAPLLTGIDGLHREVARQVEAFLEFL
jgi:hypothetical protein